jgi:FAD/FMN-containing dehydrogenase
VVSTTGIAGLTLGGGSQSWLIRKYGNAADNLISADVVTANGELVTANDRENADLFWALRGGGGNFGIATSLEFQLHAVGPLVLAGGAFFSWDRLKEITEFYVDYVKSHYLISSSTIQPAWWTSRAMVSAKRMSVLSARPATSL